MMPDLPMMDFVIHNLTELIHSGHGPAGPTGSATMLKDANCTDRNPLKILIAFTDEEIINVIAGNAELGDHN